MPYSTDVADQSAETSSGASWLDKLAQAATSVYTANREASAARDAARAAEAAANARTTTATQPNWLLIGGIGAAVLLLVGVLAFRK